MMLNVENYNNNKKNNKFLILELFPIKSSLELMKNQKVNNRKNLIDSKLGSTRSNMKTHLKCLSLMIISMCEVWTRRLNILRANCSSTHRFPEHLNSLWNANSKVLEKDNERQLLSRLHDLGVLIQASKRLTYN